MTMLSSLLDKARGFLARKPVGKATDAVPTGTLDQMVYDDLLDEAPALAAMAKTLRRKHGYADDLVRDTVMAFYQHRPIVRDKGEMHPKTLKNWSVAQAIAESPDTKAAREYTRHDKYASAMLAIAATSKVQELLEQNTDVEEKAEAAQQSAQQSNQAAQEVQDAAVAAAGAEAALEDAMGEFDGNGPATEQQATCAATCEGAITRLQVAITAAENAQQRAEAAEFTAEQAAEQLRSRAQGAVGEAVSEGLEQLREDEELAQAWGVGDGELKTWSYAERDAAMRLLRNSAVSKYVKLLGRWQYAERSLYAKKVVPGREEVYAVTRSGRLQDVLVSEFAALAIPELEPEFLDRWSNNQLLSRAYRGTEKTGDGAIIMCIDTSDSMNWTRGGEVTPAVWSKGFLLALMQRARRERRDFVVILFSSRNQVEVHRFPKGQATLEQTVAVVTRAFNGGTNFEAPLDKAIEILDEQYNADGARKGDIIFITDDDCDVAPAWLVEYKRRRQVLGFRTWGIAVPKTKAGSTLDALSDNVRAINSFTSPEPVADLLKAV